MATDITETEFAENNDRSLRELAQAVRDSGLTVYEIAKHANLKWQTVKNICDGIPARWDTVQRVLLVIGRRADYQRTNSNKS